MAAPNTDQMTKVQSILEQLDHAQAGQAPDNRRRAKRINIRAHLDVVILGNLNPAPLQIFTRNLSVSGLGFVSRRSFKPGERIAIKLRIAAFPAKLILARITFARYVSAGLYEVGAEFLESVPDHGHSNLPGHWLATSTSRVSKPAAPKPVPAAT